MNTPSNMAEATDVQHNASSGPQPSGQYTGWAAAQLAGQALKTPGYYYCVEQMTHAVRATKAALGTNLVMDLAACPLPEVLSRLPEDARFGVLAASRLEMNMVIAWATENAYLHAPNLDPQLARAVLGAGQRVMVETPSQIERLAQLRGRREVKPVMLAVNPAALGRDADSCLGLDRDGVFAAVAEAKAAGVALGGLALLRRAPFNREEALATVQAMRALAAQVEAEAAQPLSTLILGEWTTGLEDAEGLAAYRQALADLPQHWQPLHVAGDAIFAKAGVFLTRVVEVVPHGTVQKAICDASLASAWLLSEAAGLKRKGAHVAVLGTEPIANQPTVVVGASGFAEDVYARLPHGVAVDDVLVVADAGAWSRTLAPSALKGLGAATPYLLGSAQASEPSVQEVTHA